MIKLLKHRLEYFWLVVFLLCLNSCVYESYFKDDYYILNNTQNTVHCCFDEIQSDIVIEPDEKVFLKSVSGYRQPSPFDNSEVYLEYGWIKGTIHFNDSVSVTYSFDDTFDKSTYLLDCWDIVKEHKTMGSSTHEVLYTIDERDYQNALLQCGYDKVEE